MILTGECKESFEKWYFKNNVKSNIKFENLLPHNLDDVFGWLYTRTNVIQYAFYVDFFDSVGVYINAIRFDDNVWKPICENILSESYKTRQEATKAAIKQATEIYNDKQ